MDPAYARRIGVNVDELLVSQPDNGEQALEIAEMLVRSGAIDVVAIDSVAALVPKAEIEGEMGDSFVGLQARLMSQALRKLTGGLNRTGTVCVFTNQLREKIGVMFGSPEVTPGGRALKFYASCGSTSAASRRSRTAARRVRQPRARQGRQEQDGAAVPAGRVRHHLRRGHLLGGSVLDVGLENKVVQKSGSYFSFGEDAARPGPGERRRVPEGASRHAPRHPRGDRGRGPVIVIPGVTAPPPSDEVVEAIANGRAPIDEPVRARQA